MGLRVEELPDKLLLLHMWTFLENSVEMGEVAKVKIMGYRCGNSGISPIFSPDETSWLLL